MVFLAPPNADAVNEQQLREYFRVTLQTCRQGTLALVKGINAAVLQQQAHPDFSPVGWHLGHIAFTESLWILEHLAQQPSLFPKYRLLFAADGLPKAERQRLPGLDELLNYMMSVRQQTLAYLEIAPLGEQRRLWHWLIQHECQHSETLTLVLALHRHQGQVTPLLEPVASSVKRAPADMAFIPSGQVCLGLDDGLTAFGIHSDIAIDNELPRYAVEVAAFHMDRTPVTCEQYLTFMEAGGYHNRRWWCEAGWRWLQTAQVEQPLYWAGLEGYEQHPVSGVNWYEASAYARFVGKRLPTEAEWAMAASGLSAQCQTLLQAGQINCNHRLGFTHPVGLSTEAMSDYGCYDLLGNVWEWTNSWFRPYPGFQAYPYVGYSAVYFDDRHRVLRGGSWATRLWALRPSFRNWYEPHVRELFMGFRCAHG